MRAWVGLIGITLLTAAAPPPKRDQIPSQRALLKDWALARCMGRGLGPGKVRDDAYASASALLERGDYDVEVYNQLDRVVDAQLAKKYGGSIPGDFVTLKCLDLYHGAVLDRAVSGFKATPVR